MQISQLLEGKGAFVATVQPDVPIIDVVKEMTERSIGSLVVSDDGDTIAGIVSERDVVAAISRFTAAILDEPVRTIMSTTVQTCRSDDSIDSLMATMTDQRIRHIPVVDDGRLVGIVSIGDLVKARMDELERDRDALEHFITAR
jgi:CBS domain-containing protein